jgi:hypothetical protein
MILRSIAELGDFGFMYRQVGRCMTQPPIDVGMAPAGILKDLRGYLQCDAYPGYNRLFEKVAVVEVGCWVHAMRKFIEAEKTCVGPPTKRLHGSVRFMQLNMKENFWTHLHAQN